MSDINIAFFLKFHHRHHHHHHHIVWKHCSAGSMSLWNRIRASLIDPIPTLVLFFLHRHHNLDSVTVSLFICSLLIWQILQSKELWLWDELACLPYSSQVSLKHKLSQTASFNGSNMWHHLAFHGNILRWQLCRKNSKSKICFLRDAIKAAISFNIGWW